MDTDADKALKISTACASASAKFIPAGLPLNYYNLALAVANSVEKLLAKLPTPQQVADYQRPALFSGCCGGLAENLNYFADPQKPVKKLTLSEKDKEKLKQIRQRVRESQAKLKQRKRNPQFQPPATKEAPKQ
jgi:hypothetical protein